MEKHGGCTGGVPPGLSELLQRTVLIKQHRIVFKETAQLRLCRFFILDFNACPYRVPLIFTGAQDCGSISRTEA